MSHSIKSIKTMLAVLLIQVPAFAKPEVHPTQVVNDATIEQNQKSWNLVSIAIPDRGIITGYKTSNGGFLLESIYNAAPANLVLKAGNLLNNGKNGAINVCRSLQQVGFSRIAGEGLAGFSLSGQLNPLNKQDLQAAISPLVLQNFARITDVSPSFNLAGASFTTPERLKAFSAAFVNSVIQGRGSSLAGDGNMNYDMSGFQDVVCDLLAGNLQMNLSLQVAWDKPKVIHVPRYSVDKLQQIYNQMAQGKQNLGQSIGSRDANIIAGTVLLSQAVENTFNKKVSLNSPSADDSLMPINEFANLQIALTDSETGMVRSLDVNGINAAASSLFILEKAVYVDHLLITPVIQEDGVH